MLLSLRRGYFCLLRSPSTIPKHSALPVPPPAPAPPRMLLRLLSTLPPPEEDPPVVSLLVQSLGLPPETAQSVCGKLRGKSHKNVGPVITFFRDRGFSVDQISKIVTTCPWILLRPERTLVPKLEFFGTKGLSGRSLAEFFSSNPQILRRSLDKAIIPHFDLLRSMLKCDKKVLQVIRRPYWYGCQDTTIAANLQCLRDNGVSVSNIAYLIQCGALSYSRVRVREGVGRLKEMGLDPQKSAFQHALYAVLGMSKSTWESKARVYQNWGWSEEELLSAFRKYPLCMAASEDKINRVMSFLVERMGWKPSLVAENPVLIGQSLEMKTIPRVMVLQFLLSNDLFEKQFSPVTFLVMGEKPFMMRVSRYSDVAPRILEIYEEEQNKNRDEKGTRAIWIKCKGLRQPKAIP